jgi:hypothetical protein
MRFYHKAAITAVVVFLSALFVNAAVIPSGIPADYKGKPFCCDTLRGHYQQIPGEIKAVFFDSGGEGVAFHESGQNTTHQGDCCLRKLLNGTAIAADQPVDMQIFNTYWDWTVQGTHPDTGSWHLSWIDSDSINGEWVKMSVHVNTAGTYTIGLHEVPVDANCLTGIYFNDAPPILVSGLHVPTGSEIKSEVWHIWNIFPNVGEVELDTGLYVLKYMFLRGGFNFDKLIFTLKTPAPAGLPGLPWRQSSLNVRPLVQGTSMNVTFNVLQPGATKFTIVDCSGRIVTHFIEHSSAAGPATATMDLGKVPKGVYMLQVEQNAAKTTVPFTVYR